MAPARASDFNPYTGAPEVIVANTAITALDSNSASVSGVTVSSSNPSSVMPLQISVPEGSLTFGSTTGVTFSGASNSTFKQMSGTPANLNAALATLTYTKGASNSSTIDFAVLEDGDFFCPATNHIYRLVNNANLDYVAAKSAAAAGFSNQGYLVTPTSQAENDCVYSKILAVTGSPTAANFTWIGATAVGTPTLNGSATFEWDGGPEQGTDFWNGSRAGGAIAGQYTKWETLDSQPTVTPNEKCVTYYTNPAKATPDPKSTWHDVDCASTSGYKYVIEAGAPGSLPIVSRSTIEVSFINSQVVSWAPNTLLNKNASPATPSATATTNGNGTITYSVVDAGSTGCTVNSTSGVITYSAIGKCKVRATAAATATYGMDSEDVTFEITSGAEAETGLDLGLVVGDVAFGATINYAVYGLKPGTEWTLILRSTPQTLATGTYSSGLVTGTATLPSNLETGWHSITLTGIHPNGSTLQQKTWFKIDASGKILKIQTTEPAEETLLAKTGALVSQHSLLAALLVISGIGLVQTRNRAVRR